MNVNELDVIFISYDEPNKEFNWADLLTKCPWAKRVDGVHGSDAAHKTAANLSETDYFVTVDGDNIVDPEFWTAKDEITGRYDVLSFSATNSVNGLAYGNGGIKVWKKKFALNMKTHENAVDTKNAVEFCWAGNYGHSTGIYSQTVINETPKQAFRAGFREGVKMSLNKGIKLNKLSMKQSAHWENYHRLLAWCSIGADTLHGEWAIFGARLGVYKTMLTDWDFSFVRDFSWLEFLWESQAPAIKMSYEYGQNLRLDLDLRVCDLGAEESAFFKRMSNVKTR